MNGEREKDMMPLRNARNAGEMVTKEVEKLLWAVLTTATVRVNAEVCLRCGERLYSQEMSVL